MPNESDAKLIDGFIQECNVMGLSQHTIEGYVSTLKLFSSFLQQKRYNLLALNRDILKDYISKLRNDGIKQKTINNRFSAISSFCDYGVFEHLMEKNIVLEIRKRYLRNYKENDNNNSPRKLISIEQMSTFINAIFDTRDKAFALLFAKTGIRRRELVAIDLDDINWTNLSIKLKPTHKRSNRVVFFDSETAMILKRWLNKRQIIAKEGCKALFVSYDTGERLNRSGVYNAFIKWAVQVGLHDPCSKRIEDHFTPHCGRHWFTTHLRRAGMPRGFIQELRGDARDGAIDVYDHIDEEELRKSYIALIPQLGIE